MAHRLVWGRLVLGLVAAGAVWFFLGVGFGDSGGVHASTGSSAQSTPGSRDQDSDALASKYALYSVAELKEDRETLDRELAKLVLSSAQVLFDAGRSEIIGRGDVPLPGTVPGGDLVAYRREGDISSRVVLSREAYPDLYVLKDEADWLSGEIERRIAEEDNVLEETDEHVDLK
jgi:hypothetical protein